MLPGYSENALNVFSALFTFRKPKMRTRRSHLRFPERSMSGVSFAGCPRQIFERIERSPGIH
jgi:hypothetical protein